LEHISYLWVIIAFTYNLSNVVKTLEICMCVNVMKTCNVRWRFIVTFWNIWQRNVVYNQRIGVQRVKECWSRNRLLTASSRVTTGVHYVIYNSIIYSCIGCLTAKSQCSRLVGYLYKCSVDKNGLVCYQTVNNG
jgi:hypothetical protein